MRLALIRHGPTEWNAEKRVQGSIDIPLSAEGRTRMAALLPPAGFGNARAFASPRTRALETANLLGLQDIVIDERLAEQAWGRWEGLTRAEMMERDGADCFERAGRGLDFRPPGGESTGELHARVQGFLADVATDARDGVAVTHMGVLRAAYVLATGWDMSAPMPPGLDTSAALVLALDSRGTAGIAALNVPLRPRTAAGA